ncbi:NAD(P)-dependent oxidoreductase [Vibrio cholerae]|uniref:NAD-dependent epimerase/dehydratase family protein n=1 Tax=Vibrio cholerae TaxID=666 RepID=UPI00204D1A35|nr:NAD(P)-dependent oxidoreductase [Vibrio cholerae]MCU4202734.1 NAD(P)-dependent oxidoreductase [Vibrio cholerae]MCU4204665.1 NAD(P)-dependent oxidoreductase [Vibrio cholerae]BCN18450.1 UDP-glucose 4-epimerase [Vibrio cholerae]GHX80281.1 UDP-N-acetyl-D-quinovosamine 4-epimerase [Vibrio cholerae]
MRVLLTGSTGYLGSAIKAHYIRSGHQVITIGRSNKNDISVDLESITVIRLSELISDIDCIIHCAAINEVSINDSIDKTYSINVTLTRKLVEYAERNNVKSFIYISTFHVYGLISGDINEKSKINPINDYGLTHYLSEEIIRTRSKYSDFDYLIIRPTNIYGIPNDFESFDRWSLVPFQFVRDAILKGRIVINSSGQQYRNFVSINDVLNCFHLLGKESVVNAYGSMELSIHDFAKYISSYMKENHSVDVEVVVKGKLISGEHSINVRNTSSIYSPSYGEFDHFIERMIEEKKQWIR